MSLFAVLICPRPDELPPLEVLMQELDERDLPVELVACEDCGAALLTVVPVRAEKTAHPSWPYLDQACATLRALRSGAGAVLMVDLEDLPELQKRLAAPNN